MGVAMILRGWVSLGVDAGFLVRGTVEGSKAPSEVGSEEGRRSLSPGWGSGGIAPGKFLKFNSQICAF